MRRPADDAAELATARAECLRKLGLQPRSRWARLIRCLLTAPLFALVELLEIHGIAQHDRTGVICRCGRFIRVDDLRALGLPPRIEGPCLAARLGRWIFWKR